MAYALIINGLVQDVIGFDPAGRFHPSLVWVPCPDGVVPGAKLEADGSFTPPPEPQPR